MKFEYRSDVSNVVRTDNGYHITFNNGRSYNYGTDKVQYYPLISTRDDVRIYVNGKLNNTYNTVDNYGRYLIFRNEKQCSSPIEKNTDIEICEVKKNVEQTKSVIDYFKNILKRIGDVPFDIPAEETENKNPNQISSEILLKALDGLDLLESRSALSNYIAGANPAVRTSQEVLIYPFGCNESQKLAVETSLKNSISIVEGPPGTGKTQTILNIIANLILQNKTVAIVSNNNSAVFNVREKLEKYGYGMLVASLGNNENKASFFDNIEEQIVNPDFEISKEQLKKAKTEIEELDSILSTCFKYRNKLAILKVELSDAEIEFNHIKAEQPLNPNIKSVLNKKFFRKLDFSKILKLKNLLSSIDLDRKLSVMIKLRLILQYGLFNLNKIDQYREELSTYINHKFYELHIAKIEKDI